tara:strand:+ start:814 stop:2382 length:1569 start_codon:yes stop_codon:yes gene_type:complete
MNFLTKQSSSHMLYKFAWSLEIILCLCGILIAFTLSYLGVASLENDATFSMAQYLTIAVAFLPLFAIALTELLKIPAVTGFVYAKSIKTKLIAGFFLIVVCLLTFETMFSGQEQAFAIRTQQIQVDKGIHNRLLEKMQLYDTQIESISGLTPEQIRQTSTDGLKTQLEPLETQIAELRARENELKLSMNPAEVSEQKRQINNLEKNKDTAYVQYQEELKSLNAELTQLNKNEQIELADATFFKNSIRNKYSDQRDVIKAEKASLMLALNTKIKSIDRKIATANNLIEKLSVPSRKVKTSINSISTGILALQKEINLRIEKANNEVDATLASTASNNQRINELQLAKLELGAELNIVRDRIATSSNQSNIHRLAALYYGIDNPADVSQEDISIFALFFMASIAFVVAVAGPLIAFISMRNHVEGDAPKPNKTALAIRRAAVALRRRLLKPKVVTQINEIEVEKEVIKEIPIEKIVYKKVEVPTPFEVTKFVGVPVPTDPKDLPSAPEVDTKKVDSIFNQGEAA